MDRALLTLALALVLALGTVALAPTQVPNALPEAAKTAIEQAGPSEAEAHVKSSFRVYCNHRDRWYWDHWVDVRSHYWDYYGRHHHFGYVWHWGGAYQGRYKNACTH